MTALLPDKVSRRERYLDFVKAKTCVSTDTGFYADDTEIHPIVKPHQRAAIRWALRGGRRALFEAFGLGKSIQQIEILRLTLAKLQSGRALIVAPLGVRQEFFRDAAMLGVPLRFVRRSEEVSADGIYLTNYESVRDGKLDPHLFVAVSLDEASCLRGFGGTKTFREFMALFAGDRKTFTDRTLTAGIPYRFVATATPSPNDYIELLAYAAFLGIMDVSAAKTRFFKRNSEKADRLTIHPHKEEEFWLWVSSWALFLQRPSDLGEEYSDEGYLLPDLDVRWHEVPATNTFAISRRDRQVSMMANTASNVVEAAREKRDSLDARLAKVLELREEDPAAHRILWHDLEAERLALGAAIPGLATVYGSQDLEAREATIVAFSEGRIPELAGKPVMLGSGCNFQRHCAWAIYCGIGFKFNDFIQSVHRLHRFLQTRRVRIDLVYTENERDVRQILQRKWDQHVEMVARMSEIIRRYGLSQAAMLEAMGRAMGVDRRVEIGRHWRLAHNDCVLEMIDHMEDDSAGLVLTSIPFSQQYEYSPNFMDFGHTDNNGHFWQQMDYMIPELLRVLKPGRIACIHVKDRVVPGGLTGLGYQTIYPLHADCIRYFTTCPDCRRRQAEDEGHVCGHRFGLLAIKTVVTDVVRENNQTYRLGWSEQCKDGTKMGYGLPEYLLFFRKAPSDSSNSYADEPVVKAKPCSLGPDGDIVPFNRNLPTVPGTGYSRSRWQIDAHGYMRSSGNRLLTGADLVHLEHDQIFRLYREHSLSHVYDFEEHVALAEWLEARDALPVTFMLLQPQSWSGHVWTDVTRMRTLNSTQQQQGREQHLCLARDSRVLTKERGYVPIQDVLVGEHVLTHKGRWRPVRIVRMTGVQHAITIRAQGVPGLTLTPDHKLWVRRSDWARQSDGAERAEPGWVEARDTAGGYVNQKLTPVIEAEPSEKDEILWWVVGRWLADGHIDARGCAVISCGPDKWEDFHAKIGAFGGNTPHFGTAYQLRLRDPRRKLRSILERCGEGAGGKHLPPEAFALPERLAAALLDGYLAGDGHFLQERRRWQVSSVSRDLLLGLSHLIQRVHGAIASIHAGRGERKHVIEGRTVRARQEWHLSFNLPGRRSRPFITADGAWKKVREIEDAGEVETWCLRVEEDESFTAEGCIVKNCPMQLDIADRVVSQLSMPGEVVYDPFAGIGTVPMRAILKGRVGWGTELSPVYFGDAAYHLRCAEAEVATPSLFDLLENEEEAACAA